MNDLLSQEGLSADPSGMYAGLWSESVQGG